MTGRHRNHRRSGSGSAAPGRLIAVGVVLLAAAGVGFAVLRSGGGDTPAGCSGEIRLTVAAVPEIAPPLQKAAQKARAAGPETRCLAVEVVAAPPADVAAAIAGEKGVKVGGLGEPSAGTRVPDVWVPDSTTWLQRFATAGSGIVPDDAESIASSPVVIAMPEPVAKTLGWPEKTLTWESLLQTMLTQSGMKVGIVEPTRDAAGLSGLVALGGAARAAGPAAEQTTVGTMRALVAGRSSASDDLLARFPRAADAEAIAAGLSAAPLSEQAMIAYNATRPPVRLAGLYLDPSPPALDYPFAIMPGLDAETAAAADSFLAALAGDDFRSLLAEQGLRAADGAPAADFPSLPGAPDRATVAPVDAAVVGQALGTWISVTMPARMLAVIDVSGSMLTPVPTAGGASRGQIAVAAAKQGLSLFDNSWAVGLWTFSTELDGANDYKELVPIGPLSTQRPQLLAAIETVKPISGGQTGLYDTILAAYRTVQQGWDPASVNSVVIMTDGFNQDREGLSLSGLLAEVNKIKDPQRPINVIAIGMGNEVNEAELKKITATTGGATFIARDPSAIGEIFLKAVALRPNVAG